MVTDDEFVQGLQRCKELGALVQVPTPPWSQHKRAYSALNGECAI